jgi:uncharacterized protein (DUF433 family)
MSCPFLPSCETLRIMGGVSILERPVYSEAEAARLLRLSQGTLHYWLEGRVLPGRTYKPIIRTEPKGGRPPVTWAEFVEAGLLAQYRNHAVPMVELRNFIDRARDHYGIAYPLAHHRPYVAGKELLAELQNEAELDPEFCLVALARDQLVFTEAVNQFLRRVVWKDDLPVQWRPDAHENSPVRLNPDLKFGRPNVAGISTDVLWEHHAAGETDEEIAEEFGLAADQVRWGIGYELSVRPAA